jgi:restriction endonuclease S subunit
MSLDWPTVELGSIAKVERGVTITRKTTQPGTVPVIAGGTKPAYFHSVSNRPGGCITISGSGNAGLVNHWPEPIYASDCITVLSSDSSIIDQEFLYAFLKHKEDFIIRELSRGAAQKHVYPKDVVKIKCPVPPLKVQQELVEKLRKALAAMDELESNLQKSLKSTSDLWASTLNGLMQKSKNLVRLGDVCRYFNGKAHEPHVVPDGSYELITSKFVSSEGKLARRVNKNLSPLEYGDVVFVLSDLPNGKALAKAFLVDTSDKYALNQRVIAIRSESFIPKYLYHAVNRHPFLLAFDDGQKQTHLKLGQVLDCPINMPSLQVQSQIVQKLDDVEVALAQQKEIFELSLREVANLKQAVYKATFGGI